MAVRAEALVSAFRARGVSLFTGVPDSLLKSFCGYLTDRCAAEHVITANEGGAVGLAAGHYLATGRAAVVYLQNSGQGNAVNPLLSLADPEVYGVPMVLLVGWRGRPGEHDEPQHIKQGRVMMRLFEAMEIPAQVLPEAEDAAIAMAQAAVEQALVEARPVALAVRRGTFAPYTLARREVDLGALRREEAIEAIVAHFGARPGTVFISTTGMASRELYEIRARLGQGHGHDFLTVGSMGQAAMIALGIARVQPARQVVCLDGDGATLMQMGNLAITGCSKAANLVHVVLNNGAHDSVGGQPTVGGAVDLTAIARACGYAAAEPFRGATAEDLAAYLAASEGSAGARSRFLEVRVAKGARADLGRPKASPRENKAALMAELGV